MIVPVTISPEGRDGFLLQYSGDSLMDRVYREGLMVAIERGEITVKGETVSTVPAACQGCPGWQQGECVMDSCPFEHVKNNIEK